MAQGAGEAKPTVVIDQVVLQRRPKKKDDIGFNAVENPVHVHDFQATLLHLLGINHEKLTYKFQGRHYRLTDVHGHVVKPILA